MDSNSLCLCGHQKALHHMTMTRDDGCTHRKYTAAGLSSGIVPSGATVTYCQCPEFQLDNLKYLEQLSANNPSL